MADVEGYPLVQVSSSSEFGRFLIAAEDIHPLTTVLKELPLVYGSADLEDGQSVCCGCSSAVSGPPSTCLACGWLVCDNDCAEV